MIHGIPPSHSPPNPLPPAPTLPPTRLTSSPTTLTSIPTPTPLPLLTPSTLTSTSLPLFFSLNRNTTGVFAGSTSGRKLRLRGHTGVSSSDATSGCTMLPPLLRLYAVLPVGVLTIIPSATASVRKRPPTETWTTARCGSAPRWMCTSFMA